MCFLSVWRPHTLPLDHQVSVNSMLQFHLKWWMDTKRFIQGMSIHPPDSNASLFTDASHYGWGAHLEPMRLSFHGHWTEDQSQLHINILEIMAIRFALKKVIQYKHHSCVMISTDNTTVVSYINKQGGTHSHNLWEILHWCLEHDIVLRIHHIPGKFNIFADHVSRLDRPLNTEWSLDQSVANSIFQMLSFPQCWFVCDSVQSQPLIVCISRSGQSSLSDRCIINELELSTCICISINNSDTFYSSQDTSILVQNSSYCSSLASTSLILRGVQLLVSAPNLSSIPSKITNTSKRKIPTSKSPIPHTLHLGVIKQSIRDKKFSQNVVYFVSKSRGASSQKVYDANWVLYSNWCHRKKVSAPLTVIGDFLVSFFFFWEKNVK